MHNPLNQSVLPIHIANLFAMGRRTALFPVAHELVAHQPKSALTWYAVAVYYLMAMKMAEAKRFLAKCLTIDPNFPLAFIAFGLSMSAEGEHEHAISEFSAANKLMPGSTLFLFVGDTTRD